VESHLKIDQGVDWSAPWLRVLREAGMAIADAPAWRAALNEQSRSYNHANLPIHFVPQQALPANTAYETYISKTGQVPTRDNLHDFFNALVWLTYPKIKAQLNVLQARQIELHGVGKARGAKRDAATLFDENAALLAISDTPEGRTIEHALRTHQWHQLFVQERQQFIKHVEVFLFGHATMEKLVRPYKAITAHSLICWVEPHFHGMSDSEKCAQLDRQISTQLAQIELSPAVFSPLPILGVPGWWPNQTAEFYADATVFRTTRRLG
jgi:hypothetical protein